MTALDLSALEALQRRATPAPWCGDLHDPSQCARGTHLWGTDEDDILIAALRNSFPALAAELRAAREVVRHAGDFERGYRYGIEAAGLELCRKTLTDALVAYDRARAAVSGARSSLKEKP